MYSKSKGAKKGRKSDVTLVNLKVTDKERRELNAAARKYAEGNLSQWLRLAGTAFKPTKIKYVA